MVGRELGENYPRAAQRPGGEALRVEDLEGPRLHGVSFSLRKGETLALGVLSARDAPSLPGQFSALIRLPGKNYIKWKRI